MQKTRMIPSKIFFMLFRCASFPMGNSQRGLFLLSAVFHLSALTYLYAELEAMYGPYYTSRFCE
jgi:hypothetical protein